MRSDKTALPGLRILTPDNYTDERGSFTALYDKREFARHGITACFVKDNCSVSKRGVLRGLHIQKPPQAKLVYVASGAVFDVAVDLREDSATFGEHFSIVLDSDKKQLVYIPEGFAHGFLTMSDTAVVCYKCSTYYNKNGEYGVRYDDPDLGIKWPFRPTRISKKDLALKRLNEL